jgi:hypothetical protein
VNRNLTWKYRFDIQSHEEVPNAVKDEHEDTVAEVEVIIGQGFDCNSVPLGSQSIFLKSSQVSAAKSKGNVGKQALETTLEIIKLYTKVYQ